MSRATWSYSLFLLVACAAIVGPNSAFAQDEHTSNAATWYQRAFEQFRQFTPEEIEMIDTYRTKPSQAPSPEVRALIDRAAPIVDNVIRASQQGYSDFGLDYSQGFDLLLPHLGQMRSLARLVQADSAMHMADGDGAGAAQRIAALYRLADHVGDDHVLISSIVSLVIFEVADTAAQQGFDGGTFDPASAMVLLRSAHAFDQKDPFQSIESLAMEQTLLINTVREQFMAGDEQKRAEFLAMLASEDDFDEQFGALTPEQLEVHIEQYSALMDRYAEVLAGDDPAVAKAQLAQIDLEVEAGEHGLVVQLFLPGFDRAYETMMLGRDKLHARIELLEGITRGQVDVQTLTNAAVWYRRGIERLDSLDQSWKEALAAVDPARPLLAEQIEQLTQAAIGQFVEGSNMRRCDFSIGRNALEVFIPTYADGMRDAFRLLALESMRLAAQGDAAGAAHLLGAGFRMAAHLSGDALIVSSLVTRDGFLLLSETAAGVETRHHFDEASRQELAAAVRRNGVSDPFGFVEATVNARESLHKTLIQWGESEQREQREQRLGAWLKGLDADALVCLMAMLDVTEFDYSPREPFNYARAKRLGEFLLAETMDLATIDAPMFAALAKQSRAHEFKFPETIHVVGVSVRMASARSDQWATYSWALKRAEEGRPEAEGEKQHER